ncbi:MAG: PBP1A family penicillin-binding protein [Firmicutes bacterium]|nr:PBP1A family penicillin-binding protein [Bacillota bacterium]
MFGRKKTLLYKVKNIFLKVALFLVVILLVTAGTLTVVHSSVVDIPDFTQWEKYAPLASLFYDRHGEEITALYGEQNRIYIPLEEIPLHVQQAFIAIEDERFYKHFGIDPLSIVRAFFANLRQGQWSIEQGGSTITQQLVKNAYLSPEKTLSRKIKEAYLAIQLERQFSKSEILEMYLNQIYFAHGAYGIEAASRNYFNKSAGELTVAEAALLAGIPRSPNNYSPFINFDSAQQRKNLVLHKMYENRFLTEEQWEEAKKQEIILHEFPTREYPHPYFLDYVIHHELADILSGLPRFGSREEAYKAVYTMGLKIYTTMDKKIQSAAETVLNDETLYPQNKRVDMDLMKQLLKEKDYEGYPDEVFSSTGILQPQAASVIADPSTGEVLALVGGREYNSQNQDLRYLSPRQPGSAIKPLAVYAPALEEELILPGSIVDDAPLIVGDWAPENFSRDFLGLITVREALIRSQNVPAVRIFSELTPQKGLEYAQKMGLTTLKPDDNNLAAALGGLTEGVTAFDMAQAYAVPANEGVRVNLHTVERIEDRNGVVLYEARREPEALLRPQTSYLLNDMLQETALGGTAEGLNTERPLAAKTGTTSENRDAYLVAYTPNIVVSIWLGHDIPKLGRINGGSKATLPFMNSLLEHIYEVIPPAEFRKPADISEPISICSKCGLLPGPYCPGESIVREIFPAGHIPLETCNCHVLMNICQTSGLLPGDFCPQVAGVFLLRPDFLTTDGRWKGGPGRRPEDAALMPPSHYCQEHRSWWQNFRFWNF